MRAAFPEVWSLRAPVACVPRSRGRHVAAPRWPGPDRVALEPRVSVAEAVSSLTIADAFVGACEGPAPPRPALPSRFICSFPDCSASYNKAWKLDAHLCKHTGEVTRPRVCMAGPGVRPGFGPGRAGQALSKDRGLGCQGFLQATSLHPFNCRRLWSGTKAVDKGGQEKPFCLALPPGSSIRCTLVSLLTDLPSHCRPS